MIGQELIRKSSIDELCAHRERALERFRQAALDIQAANEACQRALDGSTWYGVSEHDFRALSRCNGVNADDFVEAMRKHLDASLWRHLMDRTKLSDVMDAKARKELRDQLDKDPPPATAENVQATLYAKLGEAEMILKRGVVELVRQLSPDYKRNDAFKIGHRFVLAYVFRQFKWRNHQGKQITEISRAHGYKDEYINDLERILHVLDGKDPPQHGYTIMDQVSDKLRGNERELETDYLNVRWYLNGSAHVTIKRRDMVERINAILAEHGGLPHDRAT